MPDKRKTARSDAEQTTQAEMDYGNEGDDTGDAPTQGHTDGLSPSQAYAAGFRVVVLTRQAGLCRDCRYAQLHQQRPRTCKPLSLDIRRQHANQCAAFQPTGIDSQAA